MKMTADRILATALSDKAFGEMTAIMNEVQQANPDIEINTIEPGNGIGDLALDACDTLQIDSPNVQNIIGNGGMEIS